jgi:hypothetical protein
MPMRRPYAKGAAYPSTDTCVVTNPSSLEPATAYTSSRGERGLSKQGTATDESLGQTLKLVEFHGAFMGLSMACPNANEPQFPRESA